MEQQVKQLQEQVKAYQHDRFCQGGCAIYQYDKINKYKEFFKDIFENITLVKSYLVAMGVDNKSTVFHCIEDIQSQCECALDGTIW